MILGRWVEVLKVVSMESFSVIQELNLVRLVVLGIGKGVVSLVVWLKVRVGIPFLVDLIDR